MEIKNQLKSFFTEHWKYMAVSTACKLNVFDSFQVEKSIVQVAKELNLKEDKLTLLVNALHNEGFLTKKEDTFVINELSELLTDNHPESLKYACMNWSSEHLTAWQNLDYSIQTGKSAFEKVYGKPFFDYLNDHPEKLDAYHKAMYQYAKDDYKSLTDVIDFSKYKSVMDVGGGYGAAINNIKAMNPNVECILFDLEKVVLKVNVQKIMKISGNFFDKIPIQSEVIVLSRVLHDWNDEKANIILKNCYEALPSNGTLFVIENLAEKINDISLLSLSMTIICESYERTKNEYEKLLINNKFSIASITQLNNFQYILTAIK